MDFLYIGTMLKSIYLSQSHCQWEGVDSKHCGFPSAASRSHNSSSLYDSSSSGDVFSRNTNSGEGDDGSSWRRSCRRKLEGKDRTVYLPTAVSLLQMNSSLYFKSSAVYSFSPRHGLYLTDHLHRIKGVGRGLYHLVQPPVQCNTYWNTNQMISVR